MGYVLAAILLLTSLSSTVLCNSHSLVDPIRCNGEVGVHAISTKPYPWYIDCVRSDDGTITAYHEKCSEGQVFDPVNKKCTIVIVQPYYRPRRMVKRDTPVNPPTPACSSRQMLSCANCTALRFCSQVGGKYTWKADVTCKGNEPYCQGGKNPACVSSPPAGCDSDFPCLEEGIFPDLNNCSLYHNCYVVGESLRDMPVRCDPGYAYSGDIEGCKRKIVDDDCHVANCQHGASGLLPFPGEPRHYFYCDAGVAIFVFACPKDREFTMNRRCEVVCKAAGKMVDPDGTGCKTYIDCMPSTTAGPPYKRVLRNCPGSQLFSPITLTCGSAACP